MHDVTVSRFSITTTTDAETSCLLHLRIVRFLEETQETTPSDRPHHVSSCCNSSIHFFLASLRSYTLLDPSSGLPLLLLLHTRTLLRKGSSSHSQQISLIHQRHRQHTHSPCALESSRSFCLLWSNETTFLWRLLS